MRSNILSLAVVSLLWGCGTAPRGAATNAAVGYEGAAPTAATASLMASSSAVSWSQPVMTTGTGTDKPMAMRASLLSCQGRIESYRQQCSATSGVLSFDQCAVNSCYMAGTQWICRAGSGVRCTGP